MSSIASITADLEYVASFGFDIDPTCCDHTALVSDACGLPLGKMPLHLAEPVPCGARINVRDALLRIADAFRPTGSNVNGYSADDDNDPDSARDLARAIEHGRAALRAGDPDFYGSDNATSLTDTLANLMHWAKASDVNFAAALTSAESHFAVEQDEAETVTYQCPGCNVTVHAHRDSDAAHDHAACPACTEQGR